MMNNVKNAVVCVIVFALAVLYSHAGRAISTTPTYDYSAFHEFFSIDEKTDIYSHSVVVDSIINPCSKDEILARFPEIHEIIEKDDGEHVNRFLNDIDKYYVYMLSDGSKLYIGIANDMVDHICRVWPKCSVDLFNSIQIGKTTPDDIILLDPNAAFNPFISWGPVSFHCLDDNTFRLVTYMRRENEENFSVKGVKKISYSEWQEYVPLLYLLYE